MSRKLLLACLALAAAAPARAADYGAYLVAQFAAAENRSGDAAAAALRAMAADPGDAELRKAAFVLCLLAGRPEAVDLAAGQTDNPAAQLLLADTKARAGDWQGAELLYAELPHQELTDILRPLLMAWAQQAQGKTDQALATLQPSLEGDHVTPVYVLHAALIADVAHRDGLAARYYTEAAAAFAGSNLRLAQIIASEQARNGQYDAAAETIHQLVAANPDLAMVAPALLISAGQPAVADAPQGIAEAYVAMAATLRQQGAEDFAAILIRLAIAMRPDFTAARLLMAEVDGAHQRPNATLAELREVPGEDPLAGAVKLRMAALEARIGDTQEAVATLDALARAYPTRPEPLSELGDILADKKRYPDAISAYDHAIGRVKQPQSQDWGLFFARGIALDHNHDWPHAETDFMRGLELSPDNPAILNYVGYSWAVQGKNLDRARQMIQKALDQRPNDGAIADSLGWVMLRQGDTPGAIHWIEKAATLEPEDPTITGHLGDAYWQAGRHAEAEEQWQRALVLHPDPDDQARIEARLRSAATDAPKQP